MKDELTRSTLFHFLGGIREYIQDFNRYPHHLVRHRRSQRDLGICFEPSEETVDTSENVDEDVLARSDIVSCLKTRSQGHEGPHKGKKTKSLTRRRTPTPAKTTLAGEKTCQIDIRLRSLKHELNIYQTDTFAKRRGEGIKNVNSWNEPFFEPVVGTSARWTKLICLKCGENGAGRITFFELLEEIVFL